MKTDCEPAAAAFVGNRPNRRRLLVGLGSALALPGLPARAQPGPMHRVAFLSGASKADVADFLESLREGLRLLGYREGRNLVMDTRWANYSAEEAVKLAGEIATLQPHRQLIGQRFPLLNVHHAQSAKVAILCAERTVDYRHLLNQFRA